MHRGSLPEFAMTVSAPNSSASSPTSPSSSSSNGAISSSDFLSLLVSELQNQDPMDATSVTDFINQMTSYVNVASQQAINSSLTSLAGSFTSLVTLNSVNYIGHTVTAKTDTAQLSDGSATFGYSLASAASNVQVTITDSLGNTVYSGSGTGDAGANSFTWDGTDSTTGKQVADGQYTIA